MLIDFKTLKENHLPNFKGGEGELVNYAFQDELCKIMYGKLEPGSTIGYHTHETNSEMIFILSGTADILYEDTTETVTAGQCHYCPMGRSHSMRNFGEEDLIFYAVVPEQLSQE